MQENETKIRNLEKRKLRGCRKVLTDRLNLDEIHDELVSENLLSSEDEEKIQSCATRTERLRTFLKILEHKDHPKSYNAFHQILVKYGNYEDVVKELDNYEPPPDEDTTASEDSENNEISDGMSQLSMKTQQEDIATEEELKIVKEVIREFSSDPAILSNWKSLGRRLLLDESEIIVIQKDFRDDLKEQSFQMLHKWTEVEDEKATLKRLISALKTARCNRVAGKIENWVERRNKEI
ncbi:uncharacterized protein LOC141904010 [Tubulanus polymorphus]|uniref:uncharacterized protein LOC141904010 n=1 Tax=Tubulanus polymorphus TaxID=672921 RepID=UPI003DA5AD64